MIAHKKAATNEQEDIIQYQTGSNAVASTQQGSSAVQYALPNKRTNKNNPGVSIYMYVHIYKHYLTG